MERFNISLPTRETRKGTGGAWDGLAEGAPRAVADGAPGAVAASTDIAL